MSSLGDVSRTAGAPTVSKIYPNQPLICFALDAISSYVYQIAVKTSDGGDKGSASLDLKEAGKNSAGIVHKAVVTMQQNARRVRTRYA